jgi:hypothetical protein
MKNTDCNSGYITDTSNVESVEERQEIIPHIPTL